MKLFPVLAALVGLALMTALVAHFGVGAVIRPLVAVGWTGFAAICLIHLALIAVMGIAWGVLMPGTPLWVAVWGRLVRDAGSDLLPLSQVGGYVLGARAVTLAGVAATTATASTIVDVTLELFGQLAYTALGLFYLIHLEPDAAIATPIAVGLATAGLLAAGFLVFQRRGFDLLDRFARLLGRGWTDKTAAGAAALHAALTAIYRRRAGVFSGFILHLACWIASTLEAWVALRFAGVSLGFATVLVIESLLYAARSVAFAVPNAVGVQEGVYILLGAGFGLTPETALALSLLKRARDLTIGLPALAAWQLLEGGRLWRRIAAPERVRPAGQQNPGRNDRGFSLVSWLR
ncbi:MAG TPA: lysylphosphatidylglycerol synthase domain-containing protein [Stellaceae bacterium]|nr:lysylphosphatidylglycerol synthase domain-containing protein [Stellaceae bacterium]